MKNTRINNYLVHLIEAPTAPATHMTTRQSSKPRRPLSITTTIKDTPSSPDMIELKIYAS